MYSVVEEETKFVNNNICEVKFKLSEIITQFRTETVSKFI